MTRGGVPEPGPGPGPTTRPSVTAPGSAGDDAGTQRVRLVVVHGIGQQAVGDTVGRWAQSLVRFAQEADYTADVPTAKLVDRPATTLVRLKPPADNPRDDAPPTSEIAVVEAYWADAFAQPSLGRVLRFLLTVAPTLAVVQAIVLWRAPTSLGGPRWAVAWAGRTATQLLPFLLVAAGLALAAPLVAALLLVLLVASAVPVPAVKRFVGRSLGWLTATIGDSYLFVADPVSRAAMVTRLAECLTATVHPHPDATVVLAHSQGAAVAYRALSQLEESQRPAALITVGSGLGRLGDVGALRGRIPWYLTPLYVVAFSLLAAGLVTSSLPWTLVLVGCAGLVTAVAVLLCVPLQRDIKQVRPIAGVRWLDVWAAVDPVPNGQPVNSGDPQPSPTYELHVVPGELSVVRDHVLYDRDWGQTWPLVFRRLLDPSGDRQVGYVGVRPRTDGGGPFAPRDLVGLLLRAVPLASALYVATRVDLFELGLWLRSAVPDAVAEPVLAPVLAALTTASEVVARLTTRTVAPETLLAAGVLAGLGLLGSVLVRRTLSFLQSRETRRWLRARQSNDARWGKPRWALALVSTALVAALVPSLLLWKQEGMPWTPRQAVAAYLSALADDDVERLCAVTTGTIEELGRSDDACGEPGRPELVHVCEDAREAVAELAPEAVTVGQETSGQVEVAVSWGAESPPRCDSDESGQALTPTRLVAEGDRWLVSAVGAP